MGLTTILALLLFVILLIVIILGKWKAFLISAVCFLLLIIAIIKAPAYFQKSTDLAGEGLNEVEIGSLIDEKDTLQVKDNVIYLTLKESPGILMRVNNDVIKELTLAHEPTNPLISTMKGMNTESTFAEVVQNYGESYRNLRFVELYGVGIEYRDKKNGIILRFFFDHDAPNSEVRNIEIVKK